MGYKACISGFRDIVRAAAKAIGLGLGRIGVRRERLDLPHWPAELSGLRLALVADLHAGSPQIDEERLERIVEGVNREQVDVVGLLGDYIDPEVALGEWIEPEKIAARLARIESRLGSFAVLGNHDWGHAGARMPAALNAAGIRVLENEAVRLDGAAARGGGSASSRPLWIA